MYNPSHLRRSKHGIYYFRYSLASIFKTDRRVSISLQTRCPKQALQLSKILEYHCSIILNKIDAVKMSFIEIRDALRNHFKQVLESHKKLLEQGGPMPQQQRHELDARLMTLDVMTKGDESEFSSVCFDDEAQQIKQQEYLERTHIADKIMPIISEHGLKIEGESKDFDIMASHFRLAKMEYLERILEYDKSLRDYSSNVSHSSKPLVLHQPDSRQYTIGELVEAYLQDTKDTYDKRSCLEKLVRLLGSETPICAISVEDSRKVTDYLQKMPANAEKKRYTKGKGLEEQVEIAKRKKLPLVASSTSLKYLNYIKGFFNWCVDDDYINKNPFKNRSIEHDKKAHSRHDFTVSEVRAIINNLKKGDNKPLCENESNYWAALVAVYTGARRAEITSLLPQDVKKDEESGIWYFDITDEEETKNLKTGSAKRYIPVHPTLEELGFFEFIAKAQKYINKNPMKGEYKTRLFYDFTHSKKAKWSRNFGAWFNERYAVKIKVKTKSKTLHSLRHSFINSLQYSGDVRLETIQQIVGHEPNSITGLIYTTCDLRFLPIQLEAMKKLPY